MKAAVLQVIENAAAKSSHGNRYSADWIVDCLLIKCKSPATPQDCVQYYLGGYVAHKMKQFTHCRECVGTMVEACDSLPKEAQLVMLKMHGGL